MATLQALSLVAYLHSSEQEPRRAPSPTFTYYEDANGEWLTIGVLTPKHWPPLCSTLGRADLITDVRTAYPFARVEHAEWLREQLKVAFRAQPRAHWLDALAAVDVPCGPVYDYVVHHRSVEHCYKSSARQHPFVYDPLVDIVYIKFVDQKTVQAPIAFNQPFGCNRIAAVNGIPGSKSTHRYKHGHN